MLLSLMVIGMLSTGVSAAGPAVCPSEALSGSFESLRCCLTMDSGLDLCLAQALGQFPKETPAKLLLDRLEKLRLKEKRFDLFTHEIAHAIGRFTFSTHTSFAVAFHSCDPRFQGGCYHGVIEAAFASPAERSLNQGHLAFAEMKDRIPRLCTETIGEKLSKGLRAQCTHGLGHAILFTLDYRLKEALSGCDLLKETADRQNCLLGVFMENTTATERAKRDLKADDPLYPCNAIPAAYRSMCFLDQTRVMFHMNLSAEQIAEKCTEASGYEKECFRSLGRDLLVSLQPEGIRSGAEQCDRLGGAFAPDCIDGAVASLVDIHLQASDAYPYCSALVAQEHKKSCMDSIHRYLAVVYGYDATTIVSECRQSAPEELRSLCTVPIGTESPAPAWDLLGWLGRNILRFLSNNARGR